MGKKASEDKYTGSEKNGKRNGNGKCEYGNGDVYEGEWKNDKKNGFGVMITEDGCRYMGQFKNDKFHGYGTLFVSNDTSPDASVMSGQWVNDKAEGFSVVVTEDKICYAGQVSKSRLTGIGCTLGDNLIHAGEISDKKGMSYSIIFGFEGTVCIQRKKDGKSHGEQVTYGLDGSKRVSKYNEGVKDSISYIEMPDGSMVLGEINADGVIDGEVTIVHPDGRKVNRRFVKGVEVFA